VHLTGGLSAFIATWILGPRRGRFHDEESGEELEEPRDIPGHSVSLQLIGTFILWFGWFGFNPGSALLTGSAHYTALAGLAAANTSIAAGSAGVTILFLNLMLAKRETGKPEYNILLAMNGVLSGLVSITAGCFVMEPWAAVATGAVAAFIHLYGQRFVIWMRLDDAVDAIPIHCFNGMWGIVAIGLFANPDRIEQTFGIANNPGLFQSIVAPGVDVSGTLLGAQLVGLLAVFFWIIVTMTPFFLMMNYLGIFRSSAQDEVTGLDDVFHGVLKDGNGEQVLTAAQLEELKQRVEKKLEEELPPAPPMEVMINDDEDLSM
jgi:ammonium transporter, Amt family